MRDRVDAANAFTISSLNSLIFSYALAVGGDRGAIVIRNDSDRGEGAEAVNRTWLFIFNAVTDLQMLLFPFLEFICSCGDTDLLLHNFSCRWKGFRFREGSVLAGEEYHVLREIELDLGQRKVGEWDFF